MSNKPPDFISLAKARFLSLEKQQKSTREEKELSVADNFFSLVKKGKDTIKPKSLSFDHSCNTIPESLLASPKEYIGSDIKPNTIMSKENSIDPESKTHKTSNGSSTRTFQEYLNLIKYPKSGENNSRDYMDPKYLTTDSSFKAVHAEQKTSHNAYYDENNNHISAESSMSAGQNRKYSNSDKNDKSDCMTNKLPKRGAARGNHDFISTQESDADSNQELLYECEHCNKNFAHSHALDYHLRVHRQPFICRYCRKKYLIAAAFIQHMERHTGGRGKPFICHECDKGYFKKGNFIKHLASHVNDLDE